jgi:hypothetical protein
MSNGNREGNGTQLTPAKVGQPAPDFNMPSTQNMEPWRKTSNCRITKANGSFCFFTHSILRLSARRN